MSKWTEIITPKKRIFDLNFKELWHYKDLIEMFVRRDFVSTYKQTILGPLWFLIQPIFTTIIFTFVFGRLAGISTDGVPKVLFYMAGITLWTYFSDCFKKTSSTFIENQNIFGKVYFPRLAIPISVIISNLLKLAIQLMLFFSILFFYKLSGRADFSFQWQAFLFPVLILCLALLSMGLGLIFSAFTTKYRDLRFLLEFGVQLFMYITPIIYPASSVSGRLQTLVFLNPIAAIVETFKVGFLGSGTFTWMNLVYSIVFSILTFLVGVLIFNKTEQNFMDTV